MSESYTFQPLPLINPSLDISENHYWNYHNIEELISCKKPLTASLDEDLFIAVHQMCELAFHQMIIDMERVLKTLAQALQDATDPIIGNTAEVCYFFRRILRLYEVVNTTMPILGTMRAFAEFRTSIGPPSGFQSFQFRHLEIMSGVCKYWDGGTKNAEGKLHIAEIEFNQRYGEQVAQWFELYRQHNLTYYYQILINRAAGNSQAECLVNLQTNTNASAILQCFSGYDNLQRRFHKSHLGFRVSASQTLLTR